MRRPVRGGANALMPALMAAFAIAVITALIGAFSYSLASDMWSKFMQAALLVVGGGIVITIVIAITINVGGGRRHR